MGLMRIKKDKVFTGIASSKLSLGSTLRSSDSSLIRSMGSSLSSTSDPYPSPSQSSMSNPYPGYAVTCSPAPPDSKLHFDSNGDGWYKLSEDSYVLSHPGDDLRVSFDTTFGASVKCFPSKGGVYVSHCSPMELDFLNLPRFDTVPPSSNPAEEDAFCTRLQPLGAGWWPSIATKHAYENSKKLDPSFGLTPLVKPVQHKDKVHFFGVTSEGGVWALAVDRDEGLKKGVGRIENAANMEEKCREIEKFGGVFYTNSMDCPFLDFRGIDKPSKGDELDKGVSHEEI